MFKVTWVEKIRQRVHLKKSDPKMKMVQDGREIVPGSTSGHEATGSF